MNSQQLNDAAQKLDAAAQLRAEWSAAADNARDRNFYAQVEQQFCDRAAQVRSWAKSASYREVRGDACPVEVTAQIESAVGEFLKMAGEG